MKRQTKILTEEEFNHVSTLAHLPVTKEQIKIFMPQLSDVLNYVVTVNMLDTKNVPETAQVTGIENVFREDEVEISLTQEQALSNAPDTFNGFFVVKRVLEEK